MVTNNVYEIVVKGNSILEVKDTFINGLVEDVVVEKDGIITYFKVKGKGSFCDSYITGDFGFVQEEHNVRADDILLDLIYEKLEGK